MFGSLVLNVALIGAIGILVRQESGGLPGTLSAEKVEPSSDSVSVETTEVNVSTTREGRPTNADRTARVVSRRMDNGSVPRSPESTAIHRVSGETVKATGSSVSSIEIEAPAPNRVEHGWPVQPARKTVAFAPRIASSGQGNVQSEAGVTGAAKPDAARRDPIVSDKPLPPATPATKGTSNETPAPATVEGTPSGGANRPPWPRGSFTPEEERYRAQYGWTAFSEALREEAMGPAEP